MKNSIGKKATQLTITKLVNLIISMIIVMFLSRFRTLEEYGTYSQLNMVVALLATIIMLGLPNSINYFLAKAEDNKERTEFLSNYYTISTLLSIITGAVLLFTMPLMVKYFNNELIYSFGFVVLLLPLINIIGGSIGNLLIVYERVTLLSIYNIASGMILLGILVVSIILDFSFMNYMRMTISAKMLITLFIYYIASKLAGKLRFTINKNMIKTILKFSIPLGLAAIVGTISIELDKLMIGYFFDTETLAIYTNAAKEMPVTIIASSITAVLLPQLVVMLKEHKNEAAISLWGDATSLSYAFICFFATALFVFAPEAISILYSDKYLPGVAVFRVYNIVLLLRCTYFGMILNSIGKTKFIFYCSIASLALNVLLNYIFYLIFGLIGPAIATFVSIASMQLLQLFMTSKHLNASFKKVFPWKMVFKITLTNVLMGVSIYFLKVNVRLEPVIGEILETIILVFVWFVLYCLVMLKTTKKIWQSLSLY